MQVALISGLWLSILLDNSACKFSILPSNAVCEFLVYLQSTASPSLQDQRTRSCASYFVFRKEVPRQAATPLHQIWMSWSMIIPSLLGIDQQTVLSQTGHWPSMLQEQWCL